MSNHEGTLTLSRAAVELGAESFGFRGGEVALGGRFHIEEMLHRNEDMGTDVFRAVDLGQPSPGNRIALKVLERRTTDEFVRATTELKAYDRFKGQPGWLLIKDMGVLTNAGVEDQPRFFAVSEFATEGTMADVAKREDVKLDELLDGIGKIVDPLESLHRAGWAHRDLTPHNIFAYKGREIDWRLGDLGIIARIGSETDRAGSPKYAPPECLRSDGIVTEFWDSYGLGKVIRHVAIATRRKYDSKPDPTLSYFDIDAAMNESPVPRSALPHDLWTLIEEASRDDPEDRPTPREIADTLKTI